MVAILTPGLETRLETGDVMDYTVGEHVTGRLVARHGTRVRLERRTIRDDVPPVRLVGWTPSGSHRRVDVLRQVHAAGGPGASLAILKYGRMLPYCQWSKGTPEPLLSSPRKVDLVRVDMKDHSVLWEKAIGLPCRRGNYRPSRSRGRATTSASLDSWLGP